MKKLIICLFIISVFKPAAAQRQMEDLDRGLVAYKTGSGIMVSWRVTANEWDGVAYNVYRDGIRINPAPLTGATCYMDAGGVPGSGYAVSAVTGGVEQPKSEKVTALAQSFFDIPLVIPQGGTTPSGENYTYSPNDCSPGDLDGDGQYEIVVKWDPSNAKDNAQSGYTGNVFLDGYKLNGTRLWRIDLGKNIRAGAHYTQFMVFDLDGDGKAEIACKTADGTTDGKGAVIGNATADYRNSSGYVLSGPEYLTVFDGETGAARISVSYFPERGSVGSWGDNYGNRVDRFLAAVAYLDGMKPSLVMCRGYYTRTVLAAWDYDGSSLKIRWVFDSNNSGWESYAGQGNHNLSVADVDFDGKDEVVYGSCAIDDNGKGLYNTGLGHGDALHVSDFDPLRPGLEVFSPHESAGNGVTFRDAATGSVIWQRKAPGDTGRGLCADITAAWPGAESWGASQLGVFNHQGKVIPGSIPPINFAIWWDGDDLREILNGTDITKWGTGTLLTASGCNSNNGTKSTPALSADILGDWREEVIFRTSDNRNLRVFLTPYLTGRKQYTLMHDSHYRLSVAWQNVAYNQPPHTGFFFGDGMADPPPPQNAGGELSWQKGESWDVGTSANWLSGKTPSVFRNGDAVRFDLAGDVATPVRLSGNIRPASVKINLPSDLILQGTGSLRGPMKLWKTGRGNLLLEGNHTWSGNTTIWQGGFFINGSVDSSNVAAQYMAVVGGRGKFGNGLTVKKGASLIIGLKENTIDSLKIIKSLTLEDHATLTFDLSKDPSGKISPNDCVAITGDLTCRGRNTFVFNLKDSVLNPGDYELISFSGNFSGSIDSVSIQGLEGIPCRLSMNGKSVVLSVVTTRRPESLIWEGNVSSLWNLLGDKNWKSRTGPEWFVPNDTVVFRDNGTGNDINLNGSLTSGKVSVEADKNYRFTGEGKIAGAGGLFKSGKGKLTVETVNSFTGPTIINGGTLQAGELTNAGVSGALGSAAGDASNLVINGAILRVTGESSETNRGMTIGENGAEIQVVNGNANLTLNTGLEGEGLLSKTGPGKLTFSAGNSRSGATAIREGIVYLGSSNAISAGPGAGAVTLEGGTLAFLNNVNTYDSNSNSFIVPSGKTGRIELDGCCLYSGTLTGSGALDLYSPYIRSELNGDWSEFSGKINLVTDADGGSFLIGNRKGLEKASVNLASGVTMLYRSPGPVTIPVGELSGVAGSVLGAGGETASAITWKIGGRNSSFTFGGTIANTQYGGSGASAAVIKTGTGRMVLTGSNSYSGGTIVENGTLVAGNTAGSATGSGSVTVKSPAILTGIGIIAGPLYVEDGAGIAPGETGAGILTVSGQVNLAPKAKFSVKCNAANQQCDRLKSTEKVILDGILFITNLSPAPYTPGTQFRILDARVTEGNFTSVVPLTPGENMVWDFSDLKTAGILKVTKATGIGHFAQNPSLMLTPNPVSSAMKITSVHLPEQIRISLYDLQGRMCSVSHHRDGNEIDLDLSELKSGMYLLYLESDSSREVYKVVRR